MHVKYSGGGDNDENDDSGDDDGNHDGKMEAGGEDGESASVISTLH